MTHTETDEDYLRKSLLVKFKLKLGLLSYWKSYINS